MAQLKAAITASLLVSSIWPSYSSFFDTFHKGLEPGFLVPEGPWGDLAAARKATRLAGEQLFLVDSGSEQHVMYGVFTTAIPKYRKRLEAVMSTWGAKPKSEGRFYVVGGRTYPSQWQEPGLVVGAQDCQDEMLGNSCKEASLIAEAAKRNVSWLVVTGEDNYVDSARIEAVLRKMDPAVPAALGCLGCGKNIPQYGKFVQSDGGFCGGCGEVISQGALQLLAARGRSALIHEYGTETQCDMSTSRALRERGIPLTSFPGELSGFPIISRKEIERSSGVMIFHYVMPAAMRWLHALRTGNGDEKELHSLSSLAFAKGCMQGFESDPWFHEQVERCIELSAESRTVVP